MKFYVKFGFIATILSLSLFLFTACEKDSVTPEVSSEVSSSTDLKLAKVGGLCPNEIINPSANIGTVGWSVFGANASVSTHAGTGNSRFRITAKGSHFSQDVNIPDNSDIYCLSGYTRNSISSALTGHGYLYAYIMDASGYILQYVQLGVVNTGTSWVLNQKIGILPPNAAKMRVFLKRSNIAGVTDIGNIAYFDNISLGFDCCATLPDPLSN